MGACSHDTYERQARGLGLAQAAVEALAIRARTLAPVEPARWLPGLSRDLDELARVLAAPCPACARDATEGVLR